MEAVCFSETFIPTYHTTSCHDAQYRNIEYVSNSLRLSYADLRFTETAPRRRTFKMELLMCSTIIHYTL